MINVVTTEDDHPRYLKPNLGLYIPIRSRADRNDSFNHDRNRLRS
jgi:hypothetical protein